MSDNKLNPSHDVVVKTGSFTNEAGETKNSYMNVGVAFSNQEGKLVSMKLNAYPLPDDKGNVFLSFFEKKQN